MKLVYLWVEEYKNIHRQGFNFSPRFNCEYNDVKNELTIKKNDDYIENFFGDNINVMAIVGKNGSGKSSLLEIIYGITNNKEFQEKKFFAVYIRNVDNTFCIQNPHKFKIEKNTVLNYRFEDMWFNADNKNYHTLWINYNKKNNYLNSVYNNQSNYHMGGMDNFIFKHVHALNKYKKYLSYLRNKYLFTHMQLKLYLKDRSIIYEKNIEEKLILNEKYRKKCLDILDILTANSETRLRMNPNPNNIHDFFTYNIFLYYVNFFVLRYEDLTNNSRTFFYNSLDTILENTKIEHIFSVIKEFGKIIEQESNNFSELYNIFLVELSYIKENLKNFILEKTMYANTSNKYIWNIDIENIEHINNIIDKTQYISGISNDDAYFINFIEYDFINIENKIHYSDLSDGEREILRIYIDLVHHVDLFQNKNIILILDEIDNSLHPVWKKEILHIFITILSEFIFLYKDTKLSLTLSTHSPFILSDIPKQNIIFLDTYRENDAKVKEKKQKVGNCRVVTNDEVFNKKQTFGQNIHTLLSDSFFMEDGLMGEFAKGKINEIIDFHKEVEKNKDDESAKDTLRTEYEKEENEKPSIKTKFWNTQSIIGDAYLKQVIKNHLVDMETILLGKDEAKEEEIRRLRAEADRLENLS